MDVNSIHDFMSLFALRNSVVDQTFLLRCYHGHCNYIIENIYYFLSESRIFQQLQHFMFKIMVFNIFIKKLDIIDNITWFITLNSTP